MKESSGVYLSAMETAWNKRIMFEWMAPPGLPPIKWFLPHISLPVHPLRWSLTSRHGGDCVCAQMDRSVAASPGNFKHGSVNGILMRQSLRIRPTTTVEQTRATLGLFSRKHSGNGGCSCLLLRCLVYGNLRGRWQQNFTYGEGVMGVTVGDFSKY